MRTESARPFVERVADQHFPWHYTEFGVLCACGRPCDGNEDCAVMRRARRWDVSAPSTMTTTHPNPADRAGSEQEASRWLSTMTESAQRSRNGRPLRTHVRSCSAEDHFDHTVLHDATCPECGCCWGCDNDCCAEAFCPNPECGCSRAMRTPPGQVTP